MKVRKRKWVYPIVGPLPQIVGYVGGPLLISRGERRTGWCNGCPGRLNLVGIAPIGGGAAILGAAIASHYQATPEEMKIGVVPDYLVTGGVYRRTRNPMYLGGILMQAGWAVLLGSKRLGVVAVVYLLGMDRLGIPFEERLLYRRFGASYDRYRKTVPRWLWSPR